MDAVVFIPGDPAGVAELVDAIFVGKNGCRLGVTAWSPARVFVIIEGTARASLWTTAHRAGMRSGGDQGQSDDGKEDRLPHNISFPTTLTATAQRSHLIASNARSQVRIALMGWWRDERL
jgi:hypothetical protein